MNDTNPSWLMMLVNFEKTPSVIRVGEETFLVVRATSEDEALHVAKPLVPGHLSVAWITKIGPLSDPHVGPEWRNRPLTKDEYEALDHHRKSALAKQVN